MSLKSPSFCLDSQLAAGLDKVLVEHASFVRSRSLFKARPPALAGVAADRKLRYREDRTSCLEQAEIHLAELVWKNSEVDTLLSQQPRILLGVAGKDSDEDKNALSNLARYYSVHLYPGLSDALHNGSHELLLPHVIRLAGRLA